MGESFLRRCIKTVISFLLISVVVICAFPLKADAAFNVDLQLHCESIYMVNVETGTVVFEKNSTMQKYPASLTKIMTAMLTLEYFPDPASVMVTVRPEAVNAPEIINEGVARPANLKAGEQLTLKELLYCTMTPSDNFAALALAYFVSENFGDGTPQWFIDQMNQRAAELGCTGTHFTNPHGLYNENHYTTASDVYLIASHAMTIPFFAEMVDVTVFLRAETNMTPGTTKMYSSNKMMDSSSSYYDKRVKGVKTGYIKAAGHCFVCYAESDGYSYIIVALDDGAEVSSSTNYAFKDCKTLLDWSFSTLRLKEIVSYDIPVAEVPIELAWDKDALVLLPKESFRALLPENVGTDSVYVTVNLPESVKAPIEQGEVIGTATFTYGEIVIGSVELVSAESVERSGMLTVLDGVSSFFSSTVFLAVLGILFGLLAVYTGFFVLENRRRNKSSHVMRSSGGNRKRRKTKSNSVIRRR